MLDKPAVSDDRIKILLTEKYGLTAPTLDFQPVGNDVASYLFRVTSEGTPYFLKARPAPLYEPSCRVPHFLYVNGVKNVVAPLPDRSGGLWTELDGLAFMLYPFVDGPHGWQTDAGMSYDHWRALGSTLRQIHDLTLDPALATTIRQETFATPEISWYRDFEARFEALQSATSNEIERAFLDRWVEYRPIARIIMRQMEKLLAVLRENAGQFVICHADLHPANVLLPTDGGIRVIDWDEVKLAPKERDFIFIEEGDGDLADVPFFAGYGATDIDWVALTYYRCERVAQDLMAYAETALVMPDVSLETKASSIRGLDVMFMSGSEVEATFNAARRLPPNLAFSKP
jgi:spectinomycin phosphotransferase